MSDWELGQLQWPGASLHTSMLLRRTGARTGTQMFYDFHFIII